jgi:hypothetical protein
VYDVDQLKVNEATKAILNALARDKSHQHQHIDSQISRQDFTGGIKAWNEDTATSPSGRHLGHYKSILAHQKHDQPEDQDEESPTNRITMCHTFRVALSMVV